MFSHIFCGTLETSTQESECNTEDNIGLKLYKIELLKYQELVSVLINVLSSFEQDRANRYHFIKDKNRFIICRSLLKFLLAEYTGLTIDKISVVIEANKKPYLASHPFVFFNVSHAGDYALIAIAKRPVGIDVELINRNFDFNEILPNIFNKIEIDEIILSQEKQATFYRYWTRKEAIVKAIGKGIDDDITKIPVTNGSHSLPSSLVCDFQKLTVFSFNLNEDYIGSLAITGDVKIFQSIIFNSLPSNGHLKSLFA